ncbi:hypothetical protein HY624_02695 [Candidatus Uhrbacteria bacterium]|nr:hypothetical protein [Candidatus Uhrbacteria bacterium]
MPIFLTSSLITHFILSIVIGTFLVYLVAQAVHLHHVKVWFHALKAAIDYSLFLLSGFVGSTYYGMKIEQFIHQNQNFHLTAAVRTWIFSWLALFLVNHFFLNCKGRHAFIAAGISGLLTTILYIALLLPQLSAHPAIACWYFKC